MQASREFARERGSDRLPDETLKTNGPATIATARFRASRKVRISTVSCRSQAFRHARPTLRRKTHSSSPWQRPEVSLMVLPGPSLWTRERCTLSRGRKVVA
jgi:hypothetical protein